MTSNSNTWNLFELPVSENSTKYFEYRQYLEASVSLPDSLSRFTFNIRDVDSYILPSQAYLMASVKITKANKATAQDDGAAYALENGAPLFSEATYKIADKIIERVEYLPKKQLVNGLMSYSDDYGRSSASDQHWYPDYFGRTVAGPNFRSPGTDTLKYNGIAHNAAGITATARVAAIPGHAQADNVAQIAAYDANVTFTGGNFVGTDNPPYNPGFSKRASLAAAGIINLRIPLSTIFGYCKSVHKVSTGVSHTIELVRSQVEDLIVLNRAVAGDAEDPYVFINKIELWMPVLKPSLSAQLFVEKLLNSGGSQVLPIEYTNVYKVAGVRSGSINWNLLSTTERPLKVIIGFQPEYKTTSAKMQHVKSVFDHMKLTRASLTIAGNKVPDVDFEASFWNGTSPDRDYTRLYHEFLRCSDKDFLDTNTGTAVSFESFGDQYPLISFDLRESQDKIFTTGVSSDIILRATVSIPVETADQNGDTSHSGAYTIWAIVVSERVLRLDVVSRSTRMDVV